MGDHLPEGLDSHLTTEIDVRHPANVRMHYADIRNPIDMDAGEIRFDDLLDKVSEPDRRWYEQFVNDEGTLPVAEIPNQYADKTGRMLNKADLMKSLGFDAMTHEGGTRIGNRSHQVAIGLSPEQVYAPYLAPSKRPVPRIPPALLAALIGHNLGAGTHRVLN
jgi:hypothetical protein